MIKEPLVSVIIPTYNRADLVGRAVSSVINQDYQNFEILLVDDGSTDNTEARIKEFKDNRIIYLRHKQNKGPGAARNTGIKNSNGDYIAFLDSDEEYLPGKITKTLKVFSGSKKKPGVVCSNFYRANGGDKRVAVSKGTPFLPFPIFSKKVFAEVGLLDEGLEIYEDLDFGTRVICNFPSYFINEPLTVYHVTNGSLSSSFSDTRRLIEIKKLVLSRYENDLKRSKRRMALRNLARINYYLGKDFLKLGQTKVASEFFWRAFLAHPLKLEYFGKFWVYHFQK